MTPEAVYAAIETIYFIVLLFFVICIVGFLSQILDTLRRHDTFVDSIKRVSDDAKDVLANHQHNADVLKKLQHDKAARWPHIPSRPRSH